jgi:hypothetical protein
VKKMLWRTATTLVFGLVTAAGSMARADECFCLVNSQTAAILRGCDAFSQNQTAACTDPETGKKAIQTISNDWRRINEGADRCDPPSERPWVPLKTLKSCHEATVIDVMTPQK